MPSQPIIYWFRNDLRLHDNPALSKAISTNRPILPVFIIDPEWSCNDGGLGFPRMGQFREQFLFESLAALKLSLEKIGNTLHIFKGETAALLIRLYHKTNAAMLMAQREYAWEEIQTENQLSEEINTRFIWGSLLFQPNEVDFAVEKSPFYYTRFKNKVLGLKPIPLPLEAPTRIAPFIGELLTNDMEPFNPKAALNKNKKNIHFSGGERHALLRMHKYLKDEGPLHYAETRNFFEGKNFSSLLGPWLANGSLSPRLFYHHLAQMRQQNPDKAKNLQTIIEQLIWRDYFRFLFLRYGHRLFTVKGLRVSETGMFNDHAAFDRWKAGETGQPIVDALMHELSATGFMSNRGRMLVSFYLAKELKVNWQWGAAWFESMLLDYDVCSNYGNWAYQSGRGTDSRVNRRFNLEKQAAKFDPHGSFVERWKK